MLSITLKRSVATLGIVGGFLAAAAPAGADSMHSGVQSREPARTVTMLDYEGSPVVSLKSDSNEVAVEGITLNRTPQRVTIDLVEELGADA